jgi:hypothetical protein
MKFEVKEKETKKYVASYLWGRNGTWNIHVQVSLKLT